MTDAQRRAIELLRKASAARPDDPEIPRKLVKAYLQAGKPDGALEAFTSLVRIKPLWSQYHFETIARLGNEELVTRLHEALSLAVAERPDDEIICYGLGLACQILDRLDEAIAVFERGLRANPVSALLHYNLGVALIHQDAERSREHHERAVKIAPRMAEPHFALAFGYMSENVPRARLEYMMFLELAEPYLGQYINQAQTALMLMSGQSERE